MQFFNSDKIDLLKFYMDHVITQEKINLDNINKYKKEIFCQNLNNQEIYRLTNEDLHALYNTLTKKKKSHIRDSFVDFIINHKYDAKISDAHDSCSKNKKKESLVKKIENILTQKQSLYNKIKYAFDEIIGNNIIKLEYKKRILDSFLLYQYLPLTLKEDSCIQKFNEIIKTIQNINNNNYTFFTKLYNFQENKDLAQQIINLELEIAQSYQECYQDYMMILETKQPNEEISLDLTFTSNDSSCETEDSVLEKESLHPKAKPPILNSSLVTILSCSNLENAFYSSQSN